jgi:hypothetical protein
MLYATNAQRTTIRAQRSGQNLFATQPSARIAQEPRMGRSPEFAFATEPSARMALQPLSALFIADCCVPSPKPLASIRSGPSSAQHQCSRDSKRPNDGRDRCRQLSGQLPQRYRWTGQFEGKLWHATRFAIASVQIETLCCRHRHRPLNRSTTTTISSTRLRPPP